ncbi:hypothetical protein CapIbe_011585 [Capra ibex]
MLGESPDWQLTRTQDGPQGRSLDADFRRHHPNPPYETYRGKVSRPASASSPCTSGSSSPAAPRVGCRVSRIQGHMRAHSRQQGDRPAEAEAGQIWWTADTIRT